MIGNIPVLDIRYGNVWSNIGKLLFDQLSPEIGQIFEVTVKEGDKVVFSGDIPYVNTFGDVPEGSPLIYFNSLMNLSLALNMDSFSEQNGIMSGGDWSISVKPKK